MWLRRNPQDNEWIAWLFLCSLLALLTCSGCATIRPNVAPEPEIMLGDLGPAVDAVWTAVGDLEVAFCFDAIEARNAPGTWVVVGVRLPRQQGTATSVSFDCRPSPGFGHNHPSRNAKCTLSPADTAKFRDDRHEFHILWCGPGNMVGNLRADVTR